MLTTNVRSLIPVISKFFKATYPSQAPLFTKNGTTYIQTSTPFINNDGARHPDSAHYPNYLGASCALHTSDCLFTSVKRNVRPRCQ
jgi:hypothetical protein